jgi:hypothetical protein
MKTVRTLLASLIERGLPLDDNDRRAIGAQPAGVLLGALIEALQDDRLDRRQLDLLCQIAAPFVRREVDSKIVALLADERVSIRNRAALFAFISEQHPTPEGTLRLISAVPAELIARLAQHTVLDLLASSRTGDATHARVLLSQPDALASSVVRDWNALRASLSLPAHELFAAVLDDAAIWSMPLTLSQVLDAVAVEAHGDGIALLQRARRGCPKSARTVVQQALVTAMASGAGAAAARSEESFEGWSTRADGKGAIGCFLVRTNADETLYVAHICVRLASGVRFGAVHPRMSRAEFVAMRREMGLATTRAPAVELAALVAQCVARDERGESEPVEEPLDEHARRALAAFARVGAVDPPLAPPARFVSDEKACELLGDEDCQDWWFDDEDLGLDDDVVDAPDPTLAQLASGAAPERVAAMCRYQSHRCRWGGRELAASQWAALAVEVDRNFARSRVARWMFDSTSMLEELGLPDSSSGGLLRWADAFPARRAEQWMISDVDAARPILVEELYCDRPGCDCDKVTLRPRYSTGLPLVGISYMFDPESEWLAGGLERFVIEPNVPAGPKGLSLAAHIHERLKQDSAWVELLRSHYRECKAHVRGEPSTLPVADPSAAQPAPGAVFIERSSVGRNDPCPCGSGRKFKKCHGA